MKLIRTEDVTPAVLTSSSVAEATSWSNGTPYAIGDEVDVAELSSVVTISIAAPGVVTWAANGVPNGARLKLTTTGALPTGLTAGEWYWVVNRAAGSLQLSATEDGDPITTTGSQSGTHTATAAIHGTFRSLIGPNSGNPPAIDDGTKWARISATNRWAMFDALVQSQTTNATSIVVALDFADTVRLDTLALLNLAGVEATVAATDLVDGVVYNQTFSLVSASGITDPYAWCFEPIARIRDLILTDLPIGYSGLVVSVTISAPGETAACGALVTGQAKTLGGTRWDTQIGVRDFSLKEDDGFGGLSIVERSYRKRATFSVVLLNSFLDELATTLADYRARPALWIGNDSFAAMAIWGFVKDWNIEASLAPDASLCSLELESLT